MLKVMQVLLGIVLFAAPLLAQDQADAARMAAGCGANEIQYTVKTDKKQHPITHPEPGKALVYVFSDEEADNATLHIGGVVTRWGMDGTWLGANERKSYFYFSADPGEHRLCTSRQSRFKTFTKISAAHTFMAEAGKVYYFRTKTPYVSKERPHSAEDSVTLIELDPAEAQLLIANSAFSVSHPKPVDKSTAATDTQ
jgi:hypothetical protein